MAGLIFVVTEDWYFYSHRRPMIRAAQQAGFDVSVITRVDQHRAAIEALGVRVIDFSFERRSLNPFKALAQIARLTKIYKRERPVLVHHIAMKPILFGAVAAWRAKVPVVVNAFAGLGYVFNARTLLAKAVRLGLRLPFLFLLRRPNSFLLMQNKDDLETLRRSGFVAEDRATIIRGSGVDLAAYPVVDMPPPDAGMIAVYAGRMIGIKGLPTLQQAFALLAKDKVPVSLWLYGQPDPENPGSWTSETLYSWGAQSDNVSYRGRSGDMAGVWAEAHIAVQASYGGEGVPKSLLEAAACGRAIVATDVPGCREVVRDGENGFLVPPYDAAALAAAIRKLANDPALCARMGKAGRKMVETDMSAEQVQAQTAAFYMSCLEKTGTVL
ncbi:MAG: glycosyltransferase family 4 protein [Rhodospirillales bacterium]|nr:glycosyltransferase family 4 protein [Rhodospirillales bacterium]MCB9994941.1 glycosyltransferase family 4 protein [Rhodospirillales bacterium]